MTETYYQILNCSEESSHEEIKRNYQKLVKEFHPDKFSNHGGGSVAQERYVKIDEAWRTLRDKELRKKYDASLAQSALSPDWDRLVYCRLKSSELEFDQENVVPYPCRCGSYYFIEKDDISDECCIECEECSYIIIVTNDLKS